MSAEQHYKQDPWQDIYEDLYDFYCDCGECSAIASMLAEQDAYKICPQQELQS